jgi:hypothetical protein
MKKYLFITVVLITAALSFTSCGDDEPKETVTVTGTYNLTFSQDLLNACNVFITYKAENGRNVMEAVTSTWWTKSVTSNKFPAEFGVMYKFSTKSDAELTQEQYDLTCDLNFSFRTSKGDSYTKNVTIINASDVKKDKVISTLDKYSGKSTGFRVTKDGDVYPANNLNYDN